MQEVNVSVKLLSITPTPELIIFSAARQCTSPGWVGNLWNDSGKLINKKQYINHDEINKLIKKVMKYGHKSVSEHVSLTFAISGISRSCSHQLVRHRIASYSQQSQRYCDINNLDVIIPKNIKNNNDAYNDFVNLMNDVENLYRQFIDDYNIPKEDARFILPNAIGTNLVMTMNCSELLHFFGQRLCSKAQWEIRELAKKMLKLAKDELPVVFKEAGPKCMKLKYCPEPNPCGFINA